MEDEFLLKEHEQLWNTVRNTTDLRDRWLKFYWTILAASLAGLGFLHKYLVVEQKDPQLYSEQFWLASSAILLALVVSSMIVLVALYGLRRETVEYSNDLNMIRKHFLPDESRFVRQLSISTSTEVNKRFYLSRDLGQEFCRWGIQRWILFLFPIFPSFIIGALIFSFSLYLKSIKISWLQCPWLSLVIGAVSFIAMNVMICCFGRKFDKEHAKKWQDAKSLSERNLTVDDEAIRKILTDSKTVAVVGLSPNPERDSYEVAQYLQEVGYRIIPVNPKADEILGEKAYPDLASIPETIDIVDIFRKSEHVPPIVDEAIKTGTKTVWMQLGVINDEAAKTAIAAGFNVVMDRCILREHKRLFGSD